MLRLTPFRYLAPATLGAAAAILASEGDGAALVAGGTDLLPHIKRRQRAPSLLVSVRNVREMQAIRVTAGGGLAIGAGCTLAEVARHPAITTSYPALAQAAAAIATPAIRSMATIGGNLLAETRCTFYDLPDHCRSSLGRCLKEGGSICFAAPRSARCWAIAATDTPPALLALNAHVGLVSPAGERTLPLADLYREDGLRPLANRPGEILTTIVLPPADGLRSSYHKVRRRGTIDFPLASVAVAVHRAADGKVADARIVLGAVASAPIIATEAAATLLGSHLDGEAIRTAATAAARAAHPIDNTDLTAGWRKQMVRVSVERGLRTLASTLA